MARPSLEDVLAVISGATPLLEELQAAKLTLDGYTKTVEDYTILVEAQRGHVADVVTRLQEYADQLVALYKAAEQKE